MTVERRTDDRRRRVLFSTQRPSTSANHDVSSETQIENSVARRPQQAYGPRVKRRLRSRWFSLVPIHLSSLLAFVGLTISLSLLLSLGNYYSASSDFMLQNAEIARPFKLDQPNSFGQLALICFTTASAGAALMIYQLRRYRNNDYAGHYRIWRLVIIAAILHLANLVIDLLGWSGAVIDAATGRRILLSGEDWMRLLVNIGGVTLVARLFMELRANVYASSCVLVATVFLTISEFSIWQPEYVNSNLLWILATSSMLLGCNLLFISLVIYLRQIYREIRQLDSIAWPDSSRLNNFAENEAPDSDGKDKATAQDEKTSLQKLVSGLLLAATSPLRWLLRLRKSFTDRRALAKSSRSQRASNNFKNPESDHPDRDNPIAETESRRKKWFSRRKPKCDQAMDVDTIEESPDFELIDHRKGTPPTDRAAGGGTTNEPIRQNKEVLDHEQDAISEEEIDWNEMSKSERRRLRKQMKRQNRAA
jgi:hypothetical protein